MDVIFYIVQFFNRFNQRSGYEAERTTILRRNKSRKDFNFLYLRETTLFMGCAKN